MNKYGKITQFCDTASYKSRDTEGTANLENFDFRNAKSYLEYFIE